MKKQEKRKSKSAFTVIFHDRMRVLGDSGLFSAHAHACYSLPGSLAAMQFWVAHGLSLSLSLKIYLKNRSAHSMARLQSLSGWLKIIPDICFMRHRSLSRTEVFSAEGAMGFSALLVVMAGLCARSEKSAAPFSTQKAIIYRAAPLL